VGYTIHLMDPSPLPVLAEPPAQPCAMHAGRAAVAVCANCGRAVCDLCATDRLGEIRCPVCAEAGVPWEQRRNRGRFRAYLETLRGAMVDPEKTFRTLPNERSLKDPLLYDLITQYISYSVPTVVSVLSLSSADVLAALHVALPAGISSAQLAYLPLLFYPLAGPMGVLLNLGLAALSHGAFRFMGIGKGHFARTYAAMAYGSSAAVLNVTMILSWFFVPQLWQAYSTVIGFRNAHRTSTFKATTALIVPELALIILGMVVLGTVAVEALKSSFAMPV
jgi:hypothetical protein